MTRQSTLPRIPAGAPPAIEADDALFLDFDGTLTELAATPDAVRVDRRVPALLDRLAHLLGGAVAVISGRPLFQLVRYLHGYEGAIAGIYGLERRGADGRLVIPVPVPELRAARRAMADFAASRSGVMLEEKGLALAFHFRADPRLGPDCAAFAERVARESGGRLVTSAGKMVIEIHPSAAGKDRAIAAFLDRPPFLGRRPVFVGDDRPDETAFSAVNAAGGVSVLVGARDATSAQYAVSDVPAVIDWLAGQATELARDRGADGK